MNKILVSRKAGLGRKLNLVKSILVPTMVYGCEAWIQNVSDVMSRLRALELTIAATICRKKICSENVLKIRQNLPFAFGGTFVLW